MDKHSELKLPNPERDQRQEKVADLVDSVSALQKLKGVLSYTPPAQQKKAVEDIFRGV